MKRFLLLLLLVGACADGFGGSGDQTIKTRPPTPGEMKETRERANDYYRKLPLEWQPLKYIYVGDNTLVPAYIDIRRQVEVRWKGVALPVDSVPFPREAGSAQMLPVNPTGLPVEEIDPPIAYVTTGQEGVFGMGYYDQQNGVLYRMRGVLLGPGDIPEDAKENGVLLDLSDCRFRVKIVNIDSPKPDLPETRSRESADQELGSAASTSAPNIEKTFQVENDSTNYWPWIVLIGLLCALAALFSKRKS